MDQAKNKDQRPYRKNKKKALIAAKAIEAGVDASPADKKALDLALSSLTKIRGVDDFSIEPLGPPGKYYVYMIGTKLPVDDFDEGGAFEIKWPWTSKTASVAEMTKGGGKCKMWAEKIQKMNGGDIIKIKDKFGAPGIGAVYTKSGKLISREFVEHFAVRIDDMIYDRITGPKGLKLEEYKKLFEYGEYLNFSKTVH